MTNKIVSETNVYFGERLNIYNRKVMLANNELIDYEIVKRPKVSIVIPIHSDGRIVMIKQYRAALNEYIWEFPGGVIEKNESPIAAAKRELEEEVGLIADNIRLIKEFYTAPHFTDEKIYLYLAECSTVGKKNLQEKEFITVHYMTYEQLKTEYDIGNINDAKTMISLNILFSAQVSK